MLLKFTSTDMLNTALIDVSTGECTYNIITVLLPPQLSSDDSKEAKPTLSSKRSSVREPLEMPSCECRQTLITNSSGITLVSIIWSGRRPDITILDKKIGGLTDLFGSTTVRFMPKILAIPTRFDTEYIWTATPDSLTLFDYDSDTVKGTFHQNSIRLPASFKPKSKFPSSPSCTSLSRISTPSSSPPSSTPLPTSPSPSSCFPAHDPLPPIHTDTPKSSFIPTHLPGVGSNYLEFCQHPLAHDVEIIVSFLMMEIIRRGRFSLTPYTFEKPKMWQLKETRDLVLRRLRRNTV